MREIYWIMRMSVDEWRGFVLVGGRGEDECEEFNWRLLLALAVCVRVFNGHGNFGAAGHERGAKNRFVGENHRRAR